MPTNRTRRKPRRLGAVDALSRQEELYLWAGCNLLDGFNAFEWEPKTAIKRAWTQHKDDVLADYIAQFPDTRPWAWWQFDAKKPRLRAFSAELGQEIPEPEHVYLERLGLLEKGEQSGIDRSGYAPVLDQETGYWRRATEGAPESEWIPVSKWARLARNRHMADMEHGHERGLWFDREAADRAVRYFFLFLRHWEGELAGKPFKPSPWQEWDIIRPIFGWKILPASITPKQAEAMSFDERLAARIYRRYRKVYTELCRKMGKSTLLAGVGLLLTTADREPGAKIFSAATKMDQAKLVWSTAAKMVEQSPDLEAYMICRRSTSELVADWTGNIYKPLSAEGHKMSGLNSHGNLIDELHEHSSPEILHKLITGTGARRQPLTWCITTAGARRDGVCWEEHNYSHKVLEGHPDDSYFAYITCLDDITQWDDESQWIKANPNLGISTYPEQMRELAAKAKEIPSDLNTFLRMHCDIWTEQLDYWIPMDKWDEVKPEQGPVEWRKMQLERLRGRACAGGLDLGATADLNALVLSFPEEDGSVIMLPWFWVPGENAVLRSKNDRAPYVECIRDGFITATEGNITDYARVCADIVAICKEFKVIEVDVDPLFQGAQLMQDLISEGVNVVEFAQSNTNFAEPTREMEELILSGNLQHGGNPVMRWMATNVVCRVDVNGNKRPDKKTSSEKIDGIVAGIMSLSARKRIGSQLTAESWVTLV